MRCFSILFLLFLPLQGLNSAESLKLPSSVLKAHTKKIDQLVRKKLKEKQLKPNAPVDDAEFLRRTYIRAIGRIPNYLETKSFLDSTSNDKRKALVDDVLTSNGYVHEMYIYWADILRTKALLAGFQVQPAGLPFINWIKAQVAKNVPYDQFVENMLAATGEFWQEGNESLGYYALDRATPLDNMSNTVQVFLGTRLQCAQCHNHPFDKWTQKQYFEMAAFTRSQSWNGERNNVASQLKRASRVDGKSVTFTRLERFFGSLIRFGFNRTGDGRIRLPKDYGYNDAKPLEFVYAKTIFGEDIHLDPLKRKKKGVLPDNESRLHFASWVTSENNPRFTTVIANRMWKKVMGMALIEPVDDFKDNTEASNPELLAYLEKVMKEVKYDLREFKRILFNTSTYQRKAIHRDYDNFSQCYFEGPVFKRMNGEQIWDSISVLVNSDVDQVKIKQLPTLFELNEIYRDWSSEDLLKEMTRYENKLKSFGYDTNTLLRDQVLINLILADQFPDREDCKHAMKLFQSAKDKGGYAKGFTQRKVSFNRPEVRSSEINTSKGGAQLGHLIMEFGGSNRQAIQTQRYDAELTQPLFMMNDFIEKEVVRNGNADLNKSMRSLQGGVQKIDTAYLSILNRYPTPQERDLYLKYIREHSAASTPKNKNDNPFTDVTWSLINSHEFLFIP